MVRVSPSQVPGWDLVMGGEKVLGGGGAGHGDWAGQAMCRDQGCQMAVFPARFLKFGRIYESLAVKI